jgi:hypothetical protein
MPTFEDLIWRAKRAVDDIAFEARGSVGGRRGKLLEGLYEIKTYVEAQIKTVEMRKV